MVQRSSPWTAGRDPAVHGTSTLRATMQVAARRAGYFVVELPEPLLPEPD